MTLRILRILFLPLAVIGLICIWFYVLLTMGWDQANGTALNILDL